jgi:phospholipase C
MRRRVAAALGALALAVAPSMIAMPAATAGTPPSAERLNTTTPIKHFVVLMQSGHSFDNYFGTYPGADGIPSGTCVPAVPAPGVPSGTAPSCVAPYLLHGSSISTLGQSRGIFDAQYAHGQMNGFLTAFGGRNVVGNQPMGHYDRQDLPYYWSVADNYVLFNRMFSSSSGGSLWNHMFWVTGTPGNTTADALSPAGFDAVPTIFDSLQKAGISWKFYVQNYQPAINFRAHGNAGADAQLVRVPLLNYNRFLDDPALRGHIVDMSQYYKDLTSGDLPAVSFMTPSGPSEHPPSSVKAGQAFVQSLVDALMLSPAWKTSAFMLTYDGWGGWYDHVAPPSVDAYGYGFRTPGLLVSPYAKKGHVDSTTLDSTSELKFIEDNWGVPPLAARDKAANDITTAFDFTAAPRAAAMLGNGTSAPPSPTGRMTAVYPTYGAATLLFMVLVVSAALRSRKLQTGVGR